jgi:hypothetical protein
MIPLGSLGVERCDDRRTLEEDLQQAKAFHGHLCHGMVLGVHMARYGCRVLGIDDPLTYRDLVVYIEMDRCASDAVAVVTGVTLGRRRLKWVDYGKMAATFVDLNTGEAVRIAPRPEVPHAGPDEDPLEVWKGWTEEPKTDPGDRFTRSRVPNVERRFRTAARWRLRVRFFVWPAPRGPITRFFRTRSAYRRTASL